MSKKTLLIFSFFILFQLITIVIGGEQQSKRIILNTSESGANIQSNVYNFPLVIKLDEQNFDFAISDGSDIRFFSFDNNPLYFFIERFDPTDKVAVIFVKVPEIIGNNNTQFIKMLYGDPNAPGGESASSAVFDNEHAGVWLMDTEPISGSYDAIKDRTVEGNHGTAYYMSSNDLVDGMVGKGIKFDGYNDRIWLGTASSLNQLDKNFSVSCWMKTETLAGYHKMLSSSKYHNNGFGFGIKNNNLYYAAYNRQGYEFQNFSLQSNKWYHVAATIDNNDDVHFYIDGEEKGVVNGYCTPLKNTGTFFLAATTYTYSENPQQYWKGTLDQISISSTIRSADWLKLEYENQKDNQQFIQIEAEGVDADYKIVPSVSYLTLFAKGNINIYDQADIYGDVATNDGSINIGQAADIKGDIYCGYNVYLGANTRVQGDVTAQVIIPSNANITGITREGTPVLSYFIPVLKTIDVVDWIDGLGIDTNATQRIAPGDYWGIYANENSTLILEAGKYNFNHLHFDGSYGKIIFDVAPDEEIEINVWGDVRFGYGFDMSFAGAKNPFAAEIYIDQSSLVINNDSYLEGVFILRNGDVTISQGTEVKGSIYTYKNISVGNNVQVYKPEFLTDFKHSEWAYAPPFDPDITQYHAVVPENTGSLLITPVCNKPNTSITVNGQSSDLPVILDQNPKKILIELPEATYTLTVTKNANYMIYVDDNATGSPANGESWETAYRRLEDGIFSATELGKEIWVAEGTYKYMNDGWCSPFYLYAGIELIGSFKGGSAEGETTREPEGSVYNTILNGDWANNDDLASWPPTYDDCLNYLSDNTRHVVFMWSGKGALSTKMEGFTIENGVAFSNAGISTPPWPYSTISDNFFTTGFYCEHQHQPLSNEDNGGGIYISIRHRQLKNVLFKIIMGTIMVAVCTAELDRQL